MEDIQFQEIIRALDKGRNILLHGPGGTGKCLDPDQGVLMFNGDVKAAKNVQVGDLLMGDDSTPRQVISLSEGEDEMYKVETSKGDEFIVNKGHILTLKCSYGNYIKWDERYRVFYNRGGKRKGVSFSISKFGTKEEARKAAEKYLEQLETGKGEIIDISLEEYLQKSSFWKDQYRAFKVGIDFPSKDVTLDPYFLGIWLGDGTSIRSEITSVDRVIVNWVTEYVGRFNLELKTSSKENSYLIVGKGKHNGCSNFITRQLRKYGLLGNKHIPKDYLMNSRATRMKLLAGLIDSDGHLTANCYEIIQKNKRLVSDIVFLVRSLGFGVTTRGCIKTCTNGKSGPVSGKYQRMFICGSGLEKLPLLLDRKRATSRKQIKDALVYGMKITHLGRGPYKGFTLDGNGRFLLDNFIVTHNSHSLRLIASYLQDQGKVIACTATTGVAALNLNVPEEKIIARTLHSWAGIQLGRGSPEKLLAKVQVKKHCRIRWKRVQILIIDEISMLGKSLLEKLDYIGREMRGSPRRLLGEESQPFGGIQLILSGDFLQLPPVKEEWCFKSFVWKQMKLVPFKFLEPKRYDDLRYFNLLLRLRTGKHTGQDIRLLQKRVRAYNKMQSILAKTEDSKVIKPTILFSTRADVRAYNKKELLRLPGESQEFIAEDTFVAFAKGARKQSYIQLLDDMISKELSVRVGAQIMLKINVDVQGGLVNGTRGVITNIIKGDEPIIEARFLNGKTLRLTQHVWSAEDKHGCATRKQFPILLAWAFTIHKGQGATLDYAICDLGPSIFAEGQAYVALSRVRNLRGLFISRLYPPAITVNKDALEFEESLVEGTDEPLEAHLPINGPSEL